MIANTTASGGGPIIALPAEIAHFWRGTLPPIGVVVPEGWTWGDSPYIECDYDRVCEKLEDKVNFGYDVFGWLPVNEGKALAFSCEQVIGFFPEKNGGVIVGNMNSEDPLEGFVKSITENDWALYPQEISLIDGRIFLFDSAFEGDEKPETIRAFDNVVVAALSPGIYSVYHYNNSDCVGFVRLVKKN